MKSTQNLQVDTDVLLKLKAHLAQHGGEQNVSDAISAAVDFWLDANRLPPPEGSAAADRLLGRP